MKTTKKLFALLLCVLMVAALAIPAFAADTTKLTITDTAGCTYEGYQLMTCTNSGDAYAYTVNSKYSSILKAATGAATDDAVIEKISGMNADEIRTFADKVYKAIKDASLTAEETSISANAATTITQGYWLLVETTTLADGAVRSQVLLDTKGEKDVTVTAKKALPTVDKTVDEHSVSVGETVTFTVTAKPLNFNDSYTKYYFELKDTVAKGLKINEDAVIKIGSEDKTSLFTITYGTDGASVTAKADDIKDYITASSVITMTYTATVTDAAIDDKAENDVTFTFSNDPYSDGNGGKVDDKEYVYVTNLIIDKYTMDGSKKNLSGAKFTLKNSDGKFYTLSSGKVVWSATAQEFTTNTQGAISFKGLGEGTYTLTETDPPVGYNKLKSDITIVIECSDDGVFSLGTGSTSGVTYDGTAKAFIASVENSTGTELPSTGGIGTVIFVVLGSILLIGAGIVLVTNKRMSKENF